MHVSIGGPLSHPSRGDVEGECAGKVLGGGGEGEMRGIGLQAARHLGCWNHMTIHLNERKRNPLNPICCLHTLCRQVTCIMIHASIL